MSPRKYKVIYADPPWPTQFLKRKVRPNQIEMPYKVMSVEEISKVPVRELADDDAFLFLWTTQRFLPYAFSVMNSWGFDYSRCITWDKGNGMCLHGFHNKTEFLLFGKNGKLETFPKRKAFPTVVKAKSYKHSEKPDIFRDLIEPLGEPRIELFARDYAWGWDVWGDEVWSNVELVEGNKWILAQNKSS